MRITPLAILLVIITNQNFAQDANKINIQYGIDKFILNSPKAIYDSTIRLLEDGVFTWNSKTTFPYQYNPFLIIPFELKHVKFPSLLLTFDEDDKLIQIDFSTFYSKTKSIKYKKEAKQDLRRLLAYLTAKWDKHSVEKLYYKSKISVYKGYEWYSRETVMKLTNSSVSISKQEIISISLSFKN